MEVVSDTIVALATGNLPSGIAVIRVSGDACSQILRALCVQVQPNRKLTLVNLIDPSTGKIVDQCMIFYTNGPNSFTGEDVVEFHVHGSVAVVQKLLDLLCSFSNVRLANAGEFTRRAFENARLDLSEVEGLGDLLQSETEGQRQQAIARYSGGLTQVVDAWRDVLVGNLSILEAQLDFSDEEDVGGLDRFALATDLSKVLDDFVTKIESFNYGRIVRKGFRVGILGLPNVGKSSIVNALTRSNRAIVTDEKGTTRDIQEVQVDLGGRLVLLFDSAGIRHASSKAEQEGVRRSMEMAKTCDLVLWISSPDIKDSGNFPEFDAVRPVHVLNKSDLLDSNAESTTICAAEGDIGALEQLICREYDCFNPATGVSLISRQRDVDALKGGLMSLSKVVVCLRNDGANLDLELLAEDLRHCIFMLQRLVGRVDAEDVLERVFSGFCIGK